MSRLRALGAGCDNELVTGKESPDWMRSDEDRATASVSPKYFSVIAVQALLFFFSYVQVAVGEETGKSEIVKRRMANDS